MRAVVSDEKELSAKLGGGGVISHLPMETQEHPVFLASANAFLSPLQRHCLEPYLK